MSLHSATMPATEVHQGDVRALSAFVQNAFIKGEADEVYLVYSRFISAISQRPTTTKLLPIERPEGAGSHAPADIIFQPDAKGLLDRLLPRYVDVLIYRAMAEAIAAAAGVEIPGFSLPLGPAKAAAWTLAALFKPFRKEAPLNPSRLAFFTDSKPLDIAKAVHELGYAPAFDFKTGIAATVEWYRANGWL